MIQLMSMQFCAAAAVLGRPLDTPDFISQRYDDPEVGKLAKKVELVSEEGRSSPGFEVYTRDGQVFVAEESNIDRSIHIPPTGSMQRKFFMLAQGYLDKKTIEEVISVVMNLENVKNISQLTVRLQK